MQKILILDDDSRLVKNVETYLKEFNFRIDSALNGAEVLRKVQALQPDLVILELMMPGLDGLEVCREIRKDETVPIIMLTARGEESNVVAGLEVSVDELLAGLHDRAGNVPELMKLKHRSCCLQQSGYP